MLLPFFSVSWCGAEILLPSNMKLKGKKLCTRVAYPFHKNVRLDNSQRLQEPYKTCSGLKSVIWKKLASWVVILSVTAKESLSYFSRLSPIFSSSCSSYLGVIIYSAIPASWNIALEMETEVEVIPTFLSLQEKGVVRTED